MTADLLQEPNSNSSKSFKKSEVTGDERSRRLMESGLGWVVYDEEL